MRAPDTRLEPAYTDELTLEVSYSMHKTWRMVITRDNNRRFRVRDERWNSSSARGGDAGIWEQRGRHVLAATLEAARILAQEKLSAIHDEAEG